MLTVLLCSRLTHSMVSTDSWDTISLTPSLSLEQMMVFGQFSFAHSVAMLSIPLLSVSVAGR
jgi:hypothetical protein